ncbi:hypothetical protein RM96_15360 [Cupriavidus sp. IDO]|nr:hypothetical protein RM96_15360 [Cupriavidus sp. IDO]
MLLALMPFQAWASSPALATAAESAAQTTLYAPAPMPLSDSDAAGPALPADADPAEPQQPGADLAEQLLPAPRPRFMAVPGRADPPRYAGAALPDPDLPLLSRPPRG